MPTSHYVQIPHIVEALIQASPSSILEVGIGCGKWGVLAREYLDVWDAYYEPWGNRHTCIVGIEIHELYSDSAGWNAYDEVVIGDALDIVPTLGHFDCGLMVDVLEHFDKNVGAALVNDLLDHCDKLIIAIPTVYFPTVEVWGNEHEIHRCAWTLDDFRAIGETTVHRDEDSLVVTLKAKGLHHV